MNVLYVIIAAIVGMALSLIVAQLSGTKWNWKTFLAAFIPGAVNAAAWAVKQALSGDLMTDIILAVIGGFGLPSIVSVAIAQKAMLNKVKAMQGEGGAVPKK